VTISDNDGGQVSIAANVAAASEPAANGQFTVTQTATSATDTVVSYAISGSAANGTDNTLLSGSVTVTAGTTTAVIDVTVSDDALVEGAETVIVQLTGTDNPVITVNGVADTDTVTIADDDTGQVSIAANVAAAGEPATNGQFTVTQTAIAVTDTVVSYAISGTATNGTDYALLNGSVTITAGATTALINVTVSDDALVESAETVILQLTGTSNPSITVNGAADTDTVNISNDDTSQVSIAANIAAAGEPAANGQFTVTQSTTSATDTLVSYAISGTAANGTDYTLLNGSVTVTAGTTTAVIDVTVSDDALVEGVETVILQLTGTDNPSITVNGAADTDTVNIADDDVVLVEFELPAASDFEASGLNIPQLLVRGNLAAAMTVDVNVTGGSAAAGSDFTNSATVTIPAGNYLAVPAATINLTIIDEAVIEGNETIVLQLANPAVGMLIDARQ
jgi:hypothetical protein